MLLCQGKASGGTHTTSLRAGTILPVSQLLRVERHRGHNWTVSLAPCHDDNAGSGLCRPSSFRSPSLETYLLSHASVSRVIPVQQSQPSRYQFGTTSQFMTRPPSRRARPVNINKPILDSRFSYSRGQHRHVSRNVSPLASVPKDISKKQVSTQSSNTKVRATNLPSLLLSGLPQAEKGKGNIIVKKVAAQSVLRLRDDDSSQRDFPQPSAVVKAQDEKNRAAEQLTWEKVGAERRAAEQRQLELRQARQLELDKAEEARIRREEEERFRAMRAESQKVWERWKREKVTPTDVKLNIFAVQLAQVRGELRAEVQKAKQAAHQVWAKWDHNMVAPIEAQLEALGAKVQETWTDLREYRHLLKKNREQEAAQMEDRLKEVQDFRERRADHDMSRLENIHMNKFKSHRAIHRYTDGLSEVLEAIKDFHGACGHESFSFYCAPRRMIAQSDSGIRRRALIGLFWLQEPLRTFGNDVSFQIHLWRHYKRVRIQLEIHPRAFAFKRNTSVLYGLTGNLRNITEKVWHHHQFWLRHAETGHPRDGRGEDTWDNLSSQKRRIAQLIDGTMLSISDNLSDFNRLANHRKYSDPALQRQATVLMPFREVVLGMDKLENACEDLCRDLSRANLSQRMENRIAQLRGMVRHLRRERPLILLDIDKFLYFNWDVEERIALRFNRIPAAIYSYDDARAIRPIFLPAPRYNRVNRIEHAWRHTDFQGPNGQQVTVHYCVDGETIEKTARMFLESGVVGIDLWGGREFANIDEAVMTGNDTKRCVPMVALAIDERIALFHLAVTLKPSVQEFPTLKRILADSRILKVGENMAAIKAKISKYLFFRLDGGIELDLGHLPKAVSDRGTMDSGKGSVTLSDRTLRYFGQSLCDDEVDSQHLQFALRSPKLLRGESLIPVSNQQAFAKVQISHGFKALRCL